jgi:hypothetical protein
MEQSSRTVAARDGEEIPHRDGGQDWVGSWHSPSAPPDGTPHGASGLCVTPDGSIVVVSQDGEQWDLPGGRPEGDESLEDTLRREVLEEACATVVRAKLLGFSRGICVAGPEAGLVLVGRCGGRTSCSGRGRLASRPGIDAWSPRLRS